MTTFLADEQATIDFAGRVWRLLPQDLAGWTLLLYGELGAGKSTFARALITAAGHRGPVPSPTYTLVEPYALPGITIYHIDLYRISDEEELRYLGWKELESGLRLVEWPEHAPGLAGHADLALTLHYDGDGRRVELEGLSERGRAFAERLSASQPLD